jgi:hypothetical protein
MAARQNPHVPRRLWQSGERRIPKQVVQKQATVIVDSNKDAGRTNMKYITWLLLFFALNNAHATEVWYELSLDEVGRNRVVLMNRECKKNKDGSFLGLVAVREFQGDVAYGCWRWVANKIHIIWDTTGKISAIPAELFVRKEVE